MNFRTDNIVYANEVILMYYFSKNEILDILILIQTDCDGDIVRALNLFFNRQSTVQEYCDFVSKIKDFRWGFVEINQNIRKLRKGKQHNDK
jgi:hypothetical protein